MSTADRLLKLIRTTLTPAEQQVIFEGLRQEVQKRGEIKPRERLIALTREEFCEQY